MSERKRVQEKSLPAGLKLKPGFLGYSVEKKWGTVERIMQDAVDCHINMGQDYVGNAEGDIFGNRPYDDFNIAIRASELGMKAIVFTCHVGPGFFRVPLIQKAVDDWAEGCDKRPVKVVGSVTLNYPMGGLNPEVVRMMARFGGKVVLLPTVDGSHDRKVFGLKDGIELVKRGKVVPELEEIIGIMADNNMVMDIAHVDAEDRFIIIDDAKKAGVKGFYVFNPMPAGTMIGATDEQWIDLAKRGLKLMPAGNTVTSPERFKETLNLIKKVGAENCVSGTDLNWWPGPHPVDGLMTFASMLMMQGISESDIEKIYKVNPAKLLDL